MVNKERLIDCSMIKQTRLISTSSRGMIDDQLVFSKLTLRNPQVRLPHDVFVIRMNYVPLFISPIEVKGYIG